jgi:uncharacterized protein (DUF58 family)
METSEVIRQVRKLEIVSRGLTRQIFSGEYHSALKGRGMAFSEVREYQPGDEIRTIDWNVTARFNHPYVKVFEEERELTVLLLVDLSASSEFGTQRRTKRELMTEIASVLAFSAMQNNDKVGAVFFTDRIEAFVPPGKGKSHTLRIIRDLVTFKPVGRKTNVDLALKYVSNMVKKRSTAFLLSDFLDCEISPSLKIAARKHDLVAIEVNDERESHLPDVGLLPLKHAETGEILWIDSGNQKMARSMQAQFLRLRDHWHDQLRKAGIDWVAVNTAGDWVPSLKMLFRRREK